MTGYCFGCCYVGLFSGWSCFVCTYDYFQLYAHVFNGNSVGQRRGDFSEINRILFSYQERRGGRGEGVDRCGQVHLISWMRMVLIGPLDCLLAALSTQLFHSRYM